MQLSFIGILIAAPFIGSFIGCLADRLPIGQAVVWTRSRCDHCEHPLGPRDLIPVLSWMRGGAKCRFCRQSVSAYYPAIELAALAIALSALVVPDGPLRWVTIGLGWLLLALAAMDLRHMLLADSLSLVLALSGIAVAALWSQLPLQHHIVGMLAGAGAFYVVNRIYRALRGRDGLGMGDVKLMAGAGAWLAWQGLPSVLLYSTTVALIAVAIGALLGRRLTRHTAIPFGAFLCVGIWLTWLLGPIGVST